MGTHGQTRHVVGREKLSDEEAKQARNLVLEQGIGKACILIRTADHTLEKLLDGPGITKSARDRISKRLAELAKLDAPAAVKGFMMVGQIEDGRASFAGVTIDAKGRKEDVDALTKTAVGLFGAISRR